MASKNEIPRVRQWLLSQLVSVNAPGGVHSGIAPAGTLQPYIIINHQAGMDVAGVAGIRLWTTGTWQVKAIGLIDQAGDYAALVTLADAIDAAIQRQRGAAGSDGVVISCVRQQPLALDELHSDGGVWSHLGGFYQIEASAS